MKNIAILLSALMLTWVVPAWADVSRDDATASVQKASGGRVLAVEKTERDGRAVWRVKVLTPQGEVKVVLIDAATGRGL
ncbi:MAG: PepSY domain-containing protein [Rhodoferax sp.]|uniref:PepSY domain-containing protein n=1 Tax=Rhodoferax sp. TaxID=50421 RepID=UPI00262111A5|nr:PepSY domain-containing protein [Rhodoferax sp.]MDD2878880.1 PepSY domain-containing protein [Rhodoferax sp.]